MKKYKNINNFFISLKLKARSEIMLPYGPGVVSFNQLT
jgi:hypothetical protein